MLNGRYQAKALIEEPLVRVPDGLFERFGNS
jgi:hypothetical protein